MDATKDGIDEAMAQLVAEGDLEIVGHGEDGQPLYSMTPQGIAKVEAMLPPEAVRLARGDT